MNTKFIDSEALAYFWKRISEIMNKRINDTVTKGIHACEGCGAPYKGKPNCEYCGRGFFVDFSMYRIGENNEAHIG